MRERFRLLLNGFSALAARSETCFPPLAGRFHTFRERFGACLARADLSAQAETAADHEQNRALLDGFRKATDLYHQQQEQVADAFNLLDVMRLTGKEIRHSMVLAWLLDHDLRKLGTHAQGCLGFRLFLKEFRLPLAYADCPYWVRREVAGDESIVDLEIASRGQFLIHIENKIWSSEGIDQTNREWSDVKRRASGLSINAPDIHAFFLTPSGMKATNHNFRAIRWGCIVHVLEKFAEQAKPPEVKLFASHYARALRGSIVVQVIGEDDNGKTTHE